MNAKICRKVREISFQAEVPPKQKTAMAKQIKQMKAKMKKEKAVPEEEEVEGKPKRGITAKKSIDCQEEREEEVSTSESSYFV